MAPLQPNLHSMVLRWACIQDVLKVKVEVEVKGHVIRALSFCRKNRFFSRTNGWIATKLAHDGSQPGLHYILTLSFHTIRITQLDLMSKSRNELLRH